jgi:hypothetical protein
MLYLLPCTAGARILQKFFFAAAQLGSICLRQKQFVPFFSDTILEVFHKLKALRATQGEQRLKFRLHTSAKLYLIQRHSSASEAGAEANQG